MTTKQIAALVGGAIAVGGLCVYRYKQNNFSYNAPAYVSVDGRKYLSCSGSIDVSREDDHLSVSFEPSDSRRLDWNTFTIVSGRNLLVGVKSLTVEPGADAVMECAPPSTNVIDKMPEPKPAAILKYGPPVTPKQQALLDLYCENMWSEKCKRFLAHGEVRKSKKPEPVESDPPKSFYRGANAAPGFPKS